ncbi:MAG: hypothetical protein EPO07_02150 [Verrucomicrobia bacterium]|nr:MAG: hypothetical protein EPO07_02150 [Verrucomicrobiota bacterium]
MFQKPLTEEAEVSAPTPQLDTPSPALRPHSPQNIAVTLCALGLVAAFFAPWARHSQFVSGFTFYHLVPGARLLWIIPVLALATFLRHRSPVARKWFGTVTAIAAWIGVGYFTVKAQSIGNPRFAWGATLTSLLSFALFAFSGERRIIAPIDLVARKLSSRKANVYSHSGALTPGIHFSVQEFYDTVEKAIRAKQWPGVETVRIHYTEAGVLSHKREYLRIIRQRHLFDICAATFGKDYFFSVREAEIPTVIDLRALFVLMVGLAVLFFTSIKTLGILFGPPAFLFLLAVIAWFLFNILKLGLTKMDSILMQLPVIGAIYEAWFRRDTYFQQDTRLVFLQSVTDLVKQHVEETTSAKGIRFLNCFERQPILDELYKRSRIKLEQESPKPATS